MQPIRLLLKLLLRLLSNMLYSSRLQPKLLSNELLKQHELPSSKELRKLSTSIRVLQLQ
jgi:hypothetical protein